MEKDDPIPLSVDPIGDFLEARVIVGDASATFQQNRARLEGFRRAFPVVPLQDLGASELLEHLEKLKGKGVPEPEIEEIREISQAFLDYKNKHGLGAPRERPITSDVQLVDAPKVSVGTPHKAPRPVPTAAQAQYTAPRQRSAGWIIWLLLAVGIGAAYFAWKDYTGTKKGAEGGTPAAEDAKK
jgi:hypothetical protein